MAAFDSNAYVGKFGSALGALAGYDIANQDSGTADPDSDPALDDGSAQTTAGGAAPMPNPRQMFYRPPGMNAGGGGPRPQPIQADPSTVPANIGTAPQGALGGDVQPQSPDDGLQQSITNQHVKEFNNLSDSQVKTLGNDLHDRVSADSKDKGHDVDSLDELWHRTYNADIQQNAQQRDLDEQSASKFTNPTWRDKVGMLLDATNRAGILRAQYPTVATGDIWAMATRGSLDAWKQQAKGMHDASIAQSQAFMDHAKSAANDAVEMQFQKMKYATQAQEIENKKAAAAKDTGEAAKSTAEATESPSKIDKNEAEAAKARADARKAGVEGAKAAKGDLVTLDDGTMWQITPDGNAKPVKDAQGNQIKDASKLGTKKTADDSKTLTQARETYASLLKTFQEQAKNSLDPKQRNIGAADISSQVLDHMRTTMPDQYKALTGREDSAAAASPAKKATTNPQVPDWAK